MFMTYLKVCVTGSKQKESIKRHPIFLADADYDYISDDIDRKYKIDFESTVSGNSEKE